MLAVSSGNVPIVVLSEVGMSDVNCKMFDQENKLKNIHFIGDKGDKTIEFFEYFSLDR